MANRDDFEESTRHESEVSTILREDNLLFTGREWTPLSALLRIQIERIRRQDFTVNGEDTEDSSVQLTPVNSTKEETVTVSSDTPVTSTKKETVTTVSSDQTTLVDEVLSGLKQQLTGLVMEFEEVVGKFRERQRALYAQMRQEREQRRVKEDELTAQLTDLDRNIVVLKEALLPTLSQGDASTITHLQDQVAGAQQSARRLVNTAEQAADAGLELSEGATLREGIVVLHNSVQKLGQALSEFGSVLTSTGHGVVSRPVDRLPPKQSPVAKLLASDLTDKSSEFEEEPTITLPRARSPLPSKGETWKVIRDEEDYIPPVHGPSIGSLGTLQDSGYHARTAETDSEVSRQQKSYPYESALNRFWAKRQQEDDTETSLERDSTPSGMESASKSSRRRSLVDVEAWLSTQDDQSFEITSSVVTPSSVSSRYGTPTVSTTLGTLSDRSASTYASGRSDVTGGFTPRSRKGQGPRTESPLVASDRDKLTPSSVKELHYTHVQPVATASVSEPGEKEKPATASSSPARQDVSASRQPTEKPVVKRNSMVGLFPCTSLTPPEDRVQERVRDSHRVIPFSAFMSTDKAAAPSGGRVFPATHHTTGSRRKGLEFGRRVVPPPLQGKASFPFVPGAGANWLTQHGRLVGRISSYLQVARPVVKRALVKSTTALLFGLLLVFLVPLFLPREVNLELKSALSSYAASSHVFKVKNFGLPPT
ncbi:PREDICTED: uncharacterized protein LOC109470277 [Branchiostoma belcheri]|uniref:Uncharacterized protein LOC109470277 n=1 Tax=Branchiostoma belcheri TaxID=7741 RepID=A0A6P4YJX0_BRABE|nr:PREDICTED: uncharacterized protein LOC109470277 [Branchiostoma belcheri]